MLTERDRVTCDDFLVQFLQELGLSGEGGRVRECGRVCVEEDQMTLQNESALGDGRGFWNNNAKRDFGDKRAARNALHITQAMSMDVWQECFYDGTSDARHQLRVALISFADEKVIDNISRF